MQDPVSLGRVPYLLSSGETRSISAENPTGAKSSGALAAPGDDAHCTDAARTLGRGWKVRPCLRNLEPGRRVEIAAIEGPGVVRHIWCTVDATRLHQLRLRAYYDDAPTAAIDTPLGFFFANGVDGIARVRSIPIAVNPRGGMNSYWPSPFRRRLRLEIENVGAEPIKEFFYQVTYQLEDLPDEAALLHARHRSSTTTREHPEHVLLETSGDGQYVGTYLVWTQHSTGWWGEGEVKFFIDDDSVDTPTICGTGTEDYFGGAWGFLDEPIEADRPAPFSTAYLGYPQVVDESSASDSDLSIRHGLYRWHLPDPVRFRNNLRVTVQALGWWDDGTYQPLVDDLASLALWYQAT